MSPPIRIYFVSSWLRYGVEFVTIPNPWIDEVLKIPLIIAWYIWLIVCTKDIKGDESEMKMYQLKANTMKNIK